MHEFILILSLKIILDPNVRNQNNEDLEYP